MDIQSLGLPDDHSAADLPAPDEGTFGRGFTRIERGWAQMVGALSWAGSFWGGNGPSGVRVAGWGERSTGEMALGDRRLCPRASLEFFEKARKHQHFTVIACTSLMY